MSRRAALRFALDRRATAAIEFSFLAIPFVLLILFVFQIGLYHFGLQSLDYATRFAARKIMLGEVPDGSRSIAAFKTTQLCPNFVMSFACDAVTLSVSRMPAGTGEGPGSSLSGFIDTSAMRLRQPSQTFCIGGPGDYIFIDVSYDFPNFLGSLLPAGSRTSYQLRSTNFFRNEPYKGKGMAC
jgi:Flp pilus assembly protein TadG